LAEKRLRRVSRLALGRANPIKESRDKAEQAEALRQQGKLDDAEAICSELLSRYPNYMAALHTLGLIYADRKTPLRALGPLFRAATLNPRSWRTLTALSGVCLELNALEMAAQILEQARQLNPRDANIFATLGEIYREEREYELARDAYRNAVELDPNFEAASIGLARVCISLGEYHTAVEILGGLVKRGVRSLGVLSALAQLPAGAAGIDVLKELERVVRPDSGNQSEFDNSVAFARAAALDRASRHAEAWEELRGANRMRFATRQQELRMFRDKERTSLSRLKENRAPIKSSAAAALATTLLIAGPSRSGKTSMEQLVATLPGVKRGYENPSIDTAVRNAFHEAGLITSWDLGDLPTQFHSIVREIYVEELGRRAGSAKVFTNTHPGHIHEAMQIAALLPNMRFILMKRDVDDMMLRMYMRSYYVGNPHTYNLKAIRDHVAWYYEMMERLAEKIPDRVRVIHYEDMVTDPAAALRVAADLCGLPVSDTPLPLLGDDRGCAGPYREFMTAELG